MKIDSHLTDEAVLSELGDRLRRWRLARNLSQAEFGAQAGIGRRTVQNLEAGNPVQLPSLIRVLRVLGLLESLDRLIPAPAPSPIERLQLAGRERRRAMRGGASTDADTFREAALEQTAPAGSEQDQPQPPPATAPWSWGDEPGPRP
ncbi:MAG TPA: helix-turn-helix transcriptional regulator [Solirubrobacteraceae bacterium]|nr:helix-turn-helix transcriptional regulator [Solirubrobacteraceae bacterium]